VTVRAVSRSGLYCDAECGSLPHRGDVTFLNGAAAEAAGYRACLRCRPRLCGGALHLDNAPSLVGTALNLIKEGFLHRQPEEMLAVRVGCSRQHLRRLMVRHVGASPTQIARYRQAHFARQLITETSLDAHTVARAVGLTGQHQLDRLTSTAWGQPISDLRSGRASPTPNGSIELLVRYIQPYSFHQLLRHLTPRATPGIEEVTDGSYRRITNQGGTARIFEVSDAHDGQHLRVQVHSTSYDNLIDDMERLRTLFATDEDPGPAVAHLSDDRLVGELVAQQPWLRVPRCWDPFEASVRIIVGQQISVAAATTVAGRIAHTLGQRVPNCASLDRIFPSAGDLAEADLNGLGFTHQRKTTLRHFAGAVADGSLDLRMSGAIEEVALRWCALPGIGPWTAQMAAMRILQHNDAMPSSDLGIRRSASRLVGNPISSQELDDRCAPWRPLRSWAAQHLWDSSHLIGGTG
jgi:AraC family transcriptional regulator of adaptative response / DNA-3-methyladenine glycosylase II